jgi:hypothetical protein
MINLSNILVPDGSAAALVAELKGLAGNPALRQRMGAAGRQPVRARSPWPTRAERQRHLFGTSPVRKNK